MVCRRLFFLFIALSQFLWVAAQRPTQVNEKFEQIDGLSGNCIYVSVHRAAPKSIIKKLRAELKEKGGEVKTKGDELSATGVSFLSISDSALIVKAEVQEIDKHEYNLLVIFQYNDSILSSANNESGFHSAKTFLHNLANKLSVDANENHHNQQNKALENLEKQLSTLQRKLEKEEKTIAKNKESIKENESKVEKIDKKGKLDEKAISERAKSEKAILSSRKKIKDAEYNIVINEEDQKKTLEKIETQKEVVKNAKKSLDVFK